MAVMARVIIGASGWACLKKGAIQHLAGKGKVFWVQVNGN